MRNSDGSSGPMACSAHAKSWESRNQKQSEEKIRGEAALILLYPAIKRILRLTEDAEPPLAQPACPSSPVSDYTWLAQQIAPILDGND